MKIPPLALVLLLPGLAAGATEFTLTVRDARGNPVTDAVVSLHAHAAPAVPTPSADVVIAQEDKEYDPYVTPLIVGTRVLFPNRDTVQHHIYSLSRPKRFEKPLYASGTEEAVVFDQTGVVVLGCNIHDWMIAYVVVLATPYFAKTDADGRARLEGFVPGRYRLEVWHPRVSKPETRELTIDADSNPALEISLNLRPERRIRRAPENKTGGY